MKSHQMNQGAAGELRAVFPLTGQHHLFSRTGYQRYYLIFGAGHWQTQKQIHTSHMRSQVLRVRIRIPDNWS
jgi:hypothetical protein